MMLCAAPPAPMIKMSDLIVLIFASCKPFIKPIPSVESAKILLDPFTFLNVFAAPIFFTIGENSSAEFRQSTL